MLSQGPFSYNRFDQYEKLQEAAKPDYLDFDKDGDKKEPMKKALKEKGKKQVTEKKELPDFIKDKIEKKEGKKECKDCGEKDCKCDDDKKKVDEAYEVNNADKKANTPAYQAYKAGKKDKNGNPMYKAGAGLSEGGVVKEDNLDHMIENRFAAYGGKSTDAGASIAKPSKGMKGGKTYEIKGKDGKPLFKKEEISVTKDDVIAHLIENNYVNNSVSAEVMFNHITDEFLENIEEEIMEGYKMGKKSKKSYGK